MQIKVRMTLERRNPYGALQLTHDEHPFTNVLSNILFLIDEQITSENMPVVEWRVQTCRRLVRAHISTSDFSGKT